jgi:hypothetical protein
MENNACLYQTYTMGYDLIAYVLAFESMDAQNEWDFDADKSLLSKLPPGVEDITHRFVTEKYDTVQQIWKSWRDESDFVNAVRKPYLSGFDKTFADIALTMLPNFYWRLYTPDHKRVETVLSSS